MTALVVALATCVGVPGCTVTFGHPGQSNSTPKVSAGDLQKDITQRLANAGQTPQSVTCQSDLVGQLGQSARCDVVMSPDNAFEPIATVTGLEGSKVNYDIVPSVSKTQLEASVSRMVANSTKIAPDAVSCQSGLDGKVGAVAYCDVTTHGATTKRTVEVAAVSGLSMRYGVIPVLPAAVAATSLVFQLQQKGEHPDSATCAGDLEGKVGNTVGCFTITAGNRQAYILTVTAVQGDNITYKYTATQ